MVDWPEGIPFFDLRSGYGAQPGDNVLRTPMDVGPAKVRRRTTSAPSIITGAAYMTREQAQRFEAFWRDTLKDGALSFTLDDGLYQRRNLLVQSEDFSAGWIIALGLTRTDVASVLPGRVASKFDNDGVESFSSVQQVFGGGAGGVTTATAVVENVNATGFNIGIRNGTDKVWFGIAQYTWATQSASITLGAGTVSAVQIGTGPNGGATVRVSVTTTLTSGKTSSFHVAPARTDTNANAGIIHWCQADRAPAFTQYEPVGASYPATHVTRGGLKTYRIVGVPDFGLMGLGHRVPVTLEVLP